MYDAFISYRRDGGFEMARLIYEHLRSSGINVFFDLEELSYGKFNIKLYSAIEESENFILVLPPKALDRCVNEDDWLRLEIEHAMSKKKNIVPLMMNGFSWPDNLPENMRELPHFNAVSMSREYFDASIEKLVSMLRGLGSLQEGNIRWAPTTERTENTYFSFEDNKEKRRLKIQQNLMKDFDAEVYGKVAATYEHLVVLDVGSNNGDLIMDRLGNAPNLQQVIGLEYDRRTVEAANNTYGATGKAKFFDVNAEDTDFCEKVRSIMDEKGIKSFNVINISMLLLHLKAPYKLLKNLRQFLSADGTMIIKDIDDGLNLAYPDENNEFSRVISICERNETSGYRKSGRQIYTLLKRAGYKRIKIEKVGISTASMDYEQREALFETYFSFVLDDLKIMRDRYPADKRIAADYEWYSSNYDDLEEKFQDDNMFFSLGFMLFTAHKC